MIYNKWATMSYYELEWVKISPTMKYKNDRQRYWSCVMLGYETELKLSEENCQAHIENAKQK